MTTPPPGWYPDPESPARLRYWDGGSWSGDVVAARQGRVRVDTTPDGEPVATPWSRVVAEVIDAAILVPVILLAGWPFLAAISRDNWGNLTNQVGDASSIGGATSGPSTTGPLLGFLLVALVVAVGYRVLMWGWRGSTLGQLATGLTLRPWEALGPLGLRRSVVRAGVQVGFLPFLAIPVAGWVFVLWPLVDALWVLRDERGQTLHDRFAGTCVVGGADEAEGEEEEESGEPDPLL